MMKTLLPFYERIKTDLQAQFLEIKAAAGQERLYVFGLGRVEDISGQYFAMGHTLEKMAAQLQQNPKVHYADFWWLAELFYGSEHGSISYADLEPIISDCDAATEDDLRTQYDTMLINALIELKAEGLFANEIPEFCAYIQYQDEALFLEESSFGQIFPEHHAAAFAAKYQKTANSLTTKLIEHYQLA